jgi:hypothetical protein
VADEGTTVEAAVLAFARAELAAGAALAKGAPFVASGAMSIPAAVGATSARALTVGAAAATGSTD